MLYTFGMKFASVPHLAVPIGTAAATVVAVAPHADPIAEGRRFGTFAPLDEVAFSARLEELVRIGVYGRFDGSVMVLRMTLHGTRAYGAVIAGRPDPGPGRRATVRAPVLLGVPADSEGVAPLRQLLEAESRQRPVFHATTADGATLTGFLSEQPQAILEILGHCGLDDAPETPLAVVFAGDAQAVPDGLFVGLSSDAASQ